MEHTVAWLVSANLLVASATAAPSSTEKRFLVNIEEGGTKFTQVVEIDTVNNVERITVPSHNEVDGATFVYDFNKNLTMRLTNERCFVAPLVHSLSLGLTVGPEEMLWALERSNNREGKMRATTVVNKWAIGEKMVDRTSLSPEMDKMCEGRSIFWLEPMDDLVDVGEHGAGSIVHAASRKRRQTGDSGIVPYCDDAHHKMRCRMLMSNCDYIYFANCEARIAEDRPGTREAFCHDTDTLHVYDTVLCCNDCCTDRSKSSSFLPFCDDMEFQCGTYH